MQMPGPRPNPPPRPRAPLPDNARVLLLCPVVTDELYGAAFFNLGRELARMGARVDVVTPWAIHRDFDAQFAQLQPTERPKGPSEVERYAEHGEVQDYDLVVTPDLQTARTLLIHRRLRPGTRLAATDFHMLWGMDEWVRDFGLPGRRASEGGWWPSEDLVLYSAFPGYAELYRRYGVPLSQVVWQPYVVHAPAFPADCAATEGAGIISAGRHRRDIDTLLAAAAQLSEAVQPIDLYAEGALPYQPAHIRFHGAVPSYEFCPAVGRSRFMVVPLIEDPYSAAGITAMATAIVYGRPMVASSTAATRDYVCDGVNGLLVPPGDAKALAQAIERLDTEPGLLAHLSEGARTAAAYLQPQAWAPALLRGQRSEGPAHWLGAAWGPAAR